MLATFSITSALIKDHSLNPSLQKKAIQYNNVIVQPQTGQIKAHNVIVLCNGLKSV